MRIHRYPYDWTLSETRFSKDKGKVFSCFSCGGGSTMGYKLAGYDVVGCCEIDPRVMQIYAANHHPRLPYCESVADLERRDDLPEELFHLDILDGSPPCSVFSMNGTRAKGWGVKKKFREGQAEQRLDLLFFDYIRLAKKLQPKVVVAENVKGMLLGNALQYYLAVMAAFEDAGYVVTEYLLDAADYGVPQSRERVFFVCLRKDLVRKMGGVKQLRLTPESRIPFGEVSDGLGKPLTQGSKYMFLWSNRRMGDWSLGDIHLRIYGKRIMFGAKLLYPQKVCGTITTGAYENIHFQEPIQMSRSEIIRCSTFPTDYDFGSQDVSYVCGMSVPPVLMAHIADAVYQQWLTPLNELMN